MIEEPHYDYIKPLTQSVSIFDFFNKSLSDCDNDNNIHNETYSKSLDGKKLFTFYFIFIFIDTLLNLINKY